MGSLVFWFLACLWSGWVARGGFLVVSVTLCCCNEMVWVCDLGCARWVWVWWLAILGGVGVGGFG